MNAVTPVKALPHNLEAEQALLGCLMYDAAAFAAVEGIVQPDHFYEPFHQKLFAHIARLCRDGRRADPIALKDRFGEDRAYADLGGLRYLADLVDRCPPTLQAAQFAAIVADLSSKRMLVRVGQAIQLDAGTEDSADVIVARSEALLAKVAQGAGMGDQWEDGDALCEVVDRTAAGLEKPSYVSSGYSEIDAAFGGLRKGRVTVLAGRPSMGKSAVASEIGRKIAQAGFGVGIASLEMDKQEIGLRMACGAAYDHYADTRDAPVYFEAMRGGLTEAQAANMIEGARSLRGLPLFVDCRSGLRPAQIIAAAKRLLANMRKAKVTPGVIIIDHLHIVTPDDPSGNRVVDVGAISGAFRDFAKDEDVAVLLLAQLSREVENRKVADKRPQLSDLRWSGEVEQDANTIIFIYRPEYYLIEPENMNDDMAVMKWQEDKERWKNKIIFLVRKNRGGPNNIDHEMNISLAHNALW